MSTGHGRLESKSGEGVMQGRKKVNRNEVLKYLTVLKTENTSKKRKKRKNSYNYISITSTTSLKMGL